MDNAGAGAVASAIPPKTKAKYSGIPQDANTIQNEIETTINVPSDCVSVVTSNAFPQLFIFLQTSSVPINKPTVHSKT